MPDLVLSTYWRRLTDDEIRRYTGHEGAVYDPETEIVVARACSYRTCQVFVVDKRWNLFRDECNKLGWAHGLSSAVEGMDIAMQQAYVSRWDWRIRMGLCPETRIGGTILDRKYWPKEAHDATH